MNRKSIHLIRTADVLVHGMDSRELARRTKQGKLRRIRRGFYVGSEEWNRASPADRHELFLRVAVETAEVRLPLHGISSAFVLGLPLRRLPEEAHLADTIRGGGRSQPGIVRHRPDGRHRQVLTVRTLPCSDPVNTALDVALREDFAWGVAILDRLLNPRPLPSEATAGGWDPGDRSQMEPRRVAHISQGWSLPEDVGFAEHVDRRSTPAGAERLMRKERVGLTQGPPPGAPERCDRAAIRRLIEQVVSGPKRRKLEARLAFADGDGFLPGESLSRVAMYDQGFPQPELQSVFRDRSGLIGYTDFYWRTWNLVGEFDGDAKYVKPEYLKGRTVSQVVMAEKTREDRLRRLGLTVVRWTWADVVQPERLATLLRSAGLPVSTRPRWTPLC
ncbi:type IV toxin-antitoxin system AbiEi family antitoxin domain-containing protein [Arthrobacter woluwensis]|uniref:type IV toxin-antitoxin system AbiEi family antitoxin domain-containing protein n=1 Tax=Arthrobacter woluwensis TaxID=156980 RepID=UPI0011A4E10B|nr:type IV toxin-antitoxin system AbiEi family antitoxin domain-containing protein [Arthrobacter woluwensis]